MAAPTNSTTSQYTVVARRYRPQSFTDLVGQSQVATALSNAIQQQRVGHAYLFTGARGVGKTSAARIFAKCLNCQQGPTTEPCQQCDICEGIASGEDVDVIEIDGASNNSVEEIRQLRSNVIVRPSRARFKIYIIDEVHMLTKHAFNALLKTLEEPPEHVKFIFCTTDPERILVTVLSRCQRYDFLPIQTAAIRQRLQEIVAHENVKADDEALELLARRAGGSMRDSQSLLEQLLSYCESDISVSDVHELLGTADISKVIEVAESMIGGRAAESLDKLEQAIAAGVDAGQLTEQLVGLGRDLMALKVGCDPSLILHTTNDYLPRLQTLCDNLGLEQILAILQVLDQCLVKSRYSTYVRTLLEVAIVRICHLENLDRIPELVRQLQSDAAANRGGSPARAAETEVPAPRGAAGKPIATGKKNGPPRDDSPLTRSRPTAETAPVPQPVAGQTAAPRIDWDVTQLEAVWRNVLAELGDVTADVAGNYAALEMAGTDQLVVTLKSSYDRDLCRRPERKRRLEQAVLDSTGKRIRLDFRAAESSTASEAAPAVAPPTRRQRMKQLEQDPLIRSAINLFDAEIVDVKPHKQKPR